MDLSNGASQSYWFILRDDQTQRINEFVLEEAQISPAVSSFIVESSDLAQFTQIEDHTHQENSEIELINISKSQSVQTNKIHDKEQWTEEKIKLLLEKTPVDKYGNLINERNVWNRISEAVGMSAESCTKKYSNLRNIYTRLAKKRLMRRKVKWIYYKLCDKYFRNSKTITDSETWDEPKIIKLLSLYSEKLPKLKNSELSPDEAWKYIAKCLNTSEYNCYTKFLHIKRSHYRYLQQYKNKEKTTKWPYHNYCEKIFSPYSRSSWSEYKIRLLIKTCSQYASQFQDRTCVKRELWNKISKIVGETAFNCDRKYRNLKQTYNKLKSQIESGKHTKWIFYKDFEALCNLTSSINQNSIVYKQFTANKSCNIHRLLDFVVKNKEKFQGTLHKKKYLWKVISKELGMCPDDCYAKYRNLKNTYLRLAQNKKIACKDNNWPYFSYFECIYSQNEPAKNHREVHQKVYSDKEEKFDSLIQKLKESNEIRKEGNIILKSIIERKQTSYVNLLTLS